MPVDMDELAFVRSFIDTSPDTLPCDIAKICRVPCSQVRFSGPSAPSPANWVEISDYLHTADRAPRYCQAAKGPLSPRGKQECALVPFLP